MEWRKRRRHCSFCGDSGHNKRTCQSRKNQIATFCQQRAETRKIILEKMRETGCGIGSIISVKGDTLFVKEICWDRITTNPYSSVLFALPLGEAKIYDTPDEIYGVDLPRKWFQPEDDETEWCPKIIGPINSNTIGNNLPEEWWNGISGQLPGYLQ